MKSGQDLFDREMLQAEPWSNAACCGYAHFACQALGYSAEKERAFLAALDAAFGNYPVERAKEKFLHP